MRSGLSESAGVSRENIPSKLQFNLLFSVFWPTTIPSTHIISLFFHQSAVFKWKRKQIKNHFFNDLKKNFEPSFRRIRDRLLHLRNLKKAMHVIFRSTLIFKFLPITKKMWLLKSMFWDSTVVPTSWSQPAWDWRVKKIPANKALNLRLVLENALSICKTFYDIGSLAFSRRWDKI